MGCLAPLGGQMTHAEAQERLVSLVNQSVDAGLVGIRVSMVVERPVGGRGNDRYHIG